MMVGCREEYFGIQTVDADMALSNRRMYYSYIIREFTPRMGEH
jgi:hypothetical protein